MLLTKKRREGKATRHEYPKLIASKAVKSLLITHPKHKSGRALFTGSCGDDSDNDGCDCKIAPIGDYYLRKVMDVTVGHGILGFGMLTKRI